MGDENGYRIGPAFAAAGKCGATFHGSSSSMRLLAPLATQTVHLHGAEFDLLPAYPVQGKRSKRSRTCCDIGA